MAEQLQIGLAGMLLNGTILLLWSGSTVQVRYYGVDPRHVSRSEEPLASSRWPDIKSRGHGEIGRQNDSPDRYCRNISGIVARTVDQWAAACYAVGIARVRRQLPGLSPTNLRKILLK